MIATCRLEPEFYPRQLQADLARVHDEDWLAHYNPSDYRLPHKVINRGKTSRTHLVIDGVINEWLNQQLAR